MSDNPSQWLGQVVDGKFVLQEFVGGSPSSWVFVTEREGRKAAIKLISATSRQTDARISQLEQSKNLSHPNLIRVYETGRCRLSDTALIYVVMEHAEENLAEILAQRALTPAEAGEMLPRVLDALAYLHGKGRVHGHVKPANVLATGDQVKISSDGICAMGEIPNQPSAYDAPETATRRYSTAGDTWSLGLTLVETLTQQTPHLAQSATDDPEVPGSLPQPFLDIARECLRRDPQRRPKIADIAARLRPLSSEPALPAPTPSREIGEGAAAVPAKSQNSLASWRHAIPAAVLIALALIVILVAPKVLNRLQGQSAGAAAVEPAPPMPAIKPNAAPASGLSPASEPSEANTSSSPSLAAPVEAASPAEAPPKPPSKAGVSAEVVQQVVPIVPQKARDTIQGTVKVGVRVQVDASGNVTDLSLDSPGPSKYFANLAMGAARQWKFTPAADGDTGTREWILRFQFTQDGTKAIAGPARP